MRRKREIIPNQWKKEKTATRCSSFQFVRRVFQILHLAQQFATLKVRLPRSTSQIVMTYGKDKTFNLLYRLDGGRVHFCYFILLSHDSS